MHHMGTKAKNFAALLIVLAVALLALGSAGCARAGENPQHSGTRRVRRNGLDVALRIVACQPLDSQVAGEPDRVVVKQKFTGTAPVFGAQVDFVAGWPDSPKTVQVFRVQYLFNDMFFQPGGVLITEWMAGDRPVVEAFHLRKGGAKLVFSRGSRAAPEYWDNSILINNAALAADGNYRNTTTEIWHWDGERYRLVATVPYSDRLKALAKLEHHPRDVR